VTAWEGWAQQQVQLVTSGLQSKVSVDEECGLTTLSYRLSLRAPDRANVHYRALTVCLEYHLSLRFNAVS
jgi:hypothetical protein